MIWLARLAVFIAALTTLYFNGSYAWHTADAAHGKAGFVAMALAIDLCKITFLGAAAWCWAKGYILRSCALILLWPLAFSASTFMAYAAITTQKETAAAVTNGQAGAQSRLQDRYDRTRAALATAQAAPEWRDTASCTKPRLKSHRTYCTNITTLQNSVDTLADQIGPAPTITARVELERLAERTGLSLADIAFLTAFLPALLLELIASLGSYAVGAKNFKKGSRQPVEPFSGKVGTRPAANSENGSRRVPGALEKPSNASPTPSSDPKPRLPKFPKVATE